MYKTSLYSIMHMMTMYYDIINCLNESKVSDWIMYIGPWKEGKSVRIYSCI